MRNNILTIMKKELSRFFGDRRLFFTTVFMPGIMIYVVYSFMGSGMMSQFMTDEDYVAKVYIQNMPTELEPALGTLKADWVRLAAGQSTEEQMQEVREKKADGLVIFPEHFMEQVADYQVSSGEPAPNVAIYYNSSKTESADLKQSVEAILDNYETSIANKLDVNGGDQIYDCASEKDTTGQIFSMLLPMLLMIFLYSGCVSVAPESIAGEKERGTIATLLVTPMKRSDLALGKIFGMSVIALLSGCSSFLGTFLALPKLMGGMEAGMNSNVYGTTDYLMLLGVVLSTVLVFVSLISILSAMAKSVKEAGTMVSPLMILLMLVSVTSMFGGDKPRELYRFFIPVYNSVQSMAGIFSFTYQPVQIVVTIIVNLVTAAVMAFILTRMFNSEKVMFSR